MACFKKKVICKHSSHWNFWLLRYYSPPSYVPRPLLDVRNWRVSLYVLSFPMHISSLWLPCGIAKLPTSSSLPVGACIKYSKGYWNTSAVIPRQSRLIDNYWWLVGGDKYSVEMLDKGMVPVSGTTERNGSRFHQLLRMMYNLKLANCLFLEFCI